MADHLADPMTPSAIFFSVYSAPAIHSEMFLKKYFEMFFFLILDKINDQLCSRLDLLKPPPFLYAAGSSAVQVLVYTYITSTVLDLPQDLKLCHFR